MNIFRFAFLLLATGIAFNAYSLEIVETYCTDDAKLGDWKQGIQNQRSIDDISKQFSPDFVELVSFLDSLPVQTAESEVVKHIPAIPQSRISVAENQARLQWDIQGKFSRMGIVVYFYKGCISGINLMESNKATLYSRSNILSKKP